MSEDQGPLFGGEQQDLEVAEAPWWLKDPPRPREPGRVVGVISPSRLKLASTCPAQYRGRYEDKRYSDPGVGAVVGKLDHGVYEDAALRRLRLRQGKSVPPPKASVDELLFLLEHQEAQLAAEKDLDYPITDAMFSEARDIIIKRGEVDFRHTAFAEQKISWRLPGLSNVNVGGKIDRVDLYYGPKGEVEEVVVVDYKTDKTLWTDEELKSSFQPPIYLGWARRKWPKAKSIVFELDMVRLGVPQRVAWTPDYEAQAVSRIRSILNTVKSGFSKAAVGDHCRFCPYRDGDDRYAPCRAYQTFVEREQRRTSHHGGLENMELPEVVTKIHLLDTSLKILDQRRKDLQQEAMRQLGGMTKYEAGIYTATVRGRKLDPSYPDTGGVLRDVAEMTGLEHEEVAAIVCSVKPRKLKELVRSVDDADKRARLGAMVENRQGARYGHPVVKVTKKKGVMW
jgi:RecB family exonuclease